jgi:hypothetical protein
MLVARPASGFRRYYGPQYTATASVLYAHEVGLVPITTPAYSPESNGLAEGFVHTFKRDYVNVYELRDAESDGEPVIGPAPISGLARADSTSGNRDYAAKARPWKAISNTLA